LRERYIDLARELADDLAIEVSTPEFEIATALLDLREATPKELSRLTRLSSTAFYRLLNDLRKRDVLDASQSGEDGRSKLYSLTPWARRKILGQFKRYRNSDVEAFNSLGMQRAKLEAQANVITRSVFISHLTCEYQILVYLFIRPGLANSEFYDIVDVSATKFNNSLVDLAKRGLIYSERDPKDRRRRRYFLSDDVKSRLEVFHKKVYDWLARHS